MTSVIPTSEFFTAGGTLPPDAPSYVRRPTDEDLYQNIKAGEFCYVLTPRQMGKSSLMIRTSRRLMEEGVKSAIVDLTQIGTVESEDQWYKGILSQIRRRLRMSLDPVTWWEQRRDIPNIQKFIEFFEEALLEVREPVVIFMDEIDTTLKLDFRDNFFAGIRALYNARAENSDLRRITFVLLGVASPSDLIKDRTRTPFNIGQEIPLKPFSREDARMLEQGLEAVYPGLGSQILNRVFYWTNGHPYLTQKICQSVVDEPFPFYDDGQVDHMVEKLFISEEASRETNLQFVRDSVLNHPDRKDILSVYKKILQGKEVRDNKNSVSQNHLKLAGLVRVDDGRLVASNRIYARVFDVAWVNRYTDVNWSRRVSVALGVIVLLLLSVIAYDAMYLPDRSLQASDEVISYNRDDRGVRALAKLFGLNPILLQNEYEYKAKDLFFNTLSREEQIELIDIDSYEGRRLSKSPDFKKDYKTVILGLYTSLADVDRSGQSTALLEEMQDSLKNLEMQDDPLYREIMYWVAARKGGLSDAFQNYSEAIQENPKNPATQFEMARIYVERVGYADALQAYDSVLAIVPESDIEPTAGPAPTGISGTAETAAATSSLANATAGSTPLPQSTPTTGPARSVTTPVTPPTPEITATTTSPFQSRFLTRGQRIAAVRNDITQNAALYAFYVQDQAGSYPNLVKNVPQQAETPAPGDGSSAAVQVVEFYFQNINNATQPDDLIHSWNLLTTRLQNSPNGRFTNFRDFWWQWYVSYRIYDCGSSIVSVEYRLEQRDPSSFLSPSQEFVRYILTEEKGQLKIDEGIVIDSLGSGCTLAVEFLATELTTPASTANPRQTQSITPFGGLSPGSTITYQVVAGDWLEQIARCYGADLNALLAANPRIPDAQEALTVSNVTVPNIGSAGQIYGPPCVVFYVVEAGDNWRSIAEKYNADAAVLMAANPGVTPISGTRVKVPVNSAQSTTAVLAGSETPTIKAAPPLVEGTSIFSTTAAEETIAVSTLLAEGTVFMSATGTPAGTVAPDQFIIGYFTTIINNRDFEKGWSLLTSDYQQKRAQDFQSYVSFWENTKDWELNSLDINYIDSSRAMISMNFTIHYIDEKTDPSLVETNYCLLKTDTLEQWKIDFIGNCLPQ